MTLNQSTVPDWRSDPKGFVFLGRSGNTGRSSGPHGHIEHRNTAGQLLDPTKSGLLSNVYFQRPDGQIVPIKSKGKDGQWKFDSAFPLTGHFGDDRGTHKHAGIDGALPEGTALFMPKSFITGNITEKSDPSGYGKYIDFKTKEGDLLIGHMSAINKFTVDPSQADQTASAPAAAPQPQTEPQKQNPLSTAVNIVLNLGNKDKDKDENSVEAFFLKEYLQAMEVPDYSKWIMSGKNPYETA